MILVLDNKNNIYFKDIHNIIAQLYNISIIGIFYSLDIVYKLLEFEHTDILIIDNSLPAEDKFNTENYARKNNICTYILDIYQKNSEFCAYLYLIGKSYSMDSASISVNMLSGFNNEKVTLKKPEDENTYTANTVPIDEILGEEVTDNTLELNEPIRLEDLKKLGDSITYLFNYIGIPKHLKGFIYLFTAVEMLYANPKRYNELKQSLYKNLSVKFNTTQIRISKGIRLAILQTLQRGNPAALHQLGFRKFTISEIGNDDHKNNLPSSFCFIDALVSELYRVMMDI